MSDDDLAKEHASIMRSIGLLYVYRLMYGEGPSSLVLDLAVADVNSLINNAQNSQLKTGFERTRDVLTQLKSVSGDDVPRKESFSNPSEYLVTQFTED